MTLSSMPIHFQGKEIKFSDKYGDRLNHIRSQVISINCKNLNKTINSVALLKSNLFFITFIPKPIEKK